MTRCHSSGAGAHGACHLGWHHSGGEHQKIRVVRHGRLRLQPERAMPGLLRPPATGIASTPSSTSSAAAAVTREFSRPSTMTRGAPAADPSRRPPVRDLDWPPVTNATVFDPMNPMAQLWCLSAGPAIRTRSCRRRGLLLELHPSARGRGTPPWRASPPIPLSVASAPTSGWWTRSTSST